MLHDDPSDWGHEKAPPQFAKVLELFCFILSSLLAHCLPELALFSPLRLSPLVSAVPMRYAAVQHVLDLSTGYPDAMRQHHGRRHTLRRFVCGVAHHDARIARAHSLHDVGDCWFSRTSRSRLPSAGSSSMVYSSISWPLETASCLVVPLDTTQNPNTRFWLCQTLNDQRLKYARIESLCQYIGRGFQGDQLSIFQYAYAAELAQQYGRYQAVPDIKQVYGFATAVFIHNGLIYLHRIILWETNLIQGPNLAVFQIHKL